MKTAVFLSFIVFSFILNLASATKLRPEPIELQTKANSNELPSELKELLQRKGKPEKPKPTPSRPNEEPPKPQEETLKTLPRFETASVQQLPACQYVQYCYVNRGRTVCTNTEVCI